MNAYSYNVEGVFTRACSCQRDPVRSAREGRDCFLLPVNATWIAPPDFDPETELARFDGTAWHVEELPPAPEPEEWTDPGPSEMDRLEAQVVYTAMMTDTLLEV